eukprot:scaffold13914_cov122-Isochrysis_galbana.AAC.1
MTDDRRRRKKASAQRPRPSPLSGARPAGEGGWKRRQAQARLARLVHTMHYRAGSEPRPCAACCAGDQADKQTGRGETQTLPRMVPSGCRAMIAA